MSNIPELAAQLDVELSKTSIDCDHLLTLLQQITNQTATPEGCEELNDLIFDLIPTIILAAGKSKACENAVEQLLTAAAEKCIAKEVYTALAAALSAAMQMTEATQQQLLGTSSLAFQSFLLNALAHSLLRMKKLSISFLREHLSLATNWCHYAQDEVQMNPNQDEHSCLGEEGFCNAVDPVIEAVDTRENISQEERKNAQQLLCCYIFNIVGSALRLPSRLENATKSAERTLLEAQSMLTGKLFRFQSALLDLLSGPEKVLFLITNASPKIGIKSLEDLMELQFTISRAEDHRQEEENQALGAATAVCSTILRSSSMLGLSTEGENNTACLKCSKSTGKMLQYVSFSINALTDAAAQHQSVPLALLPLLTVSQYARQLGVNETPLEESYIDKAMPIISTLVAVMSFNPVEIVRTCAYEALQAFLDAMVPQARFLVLQNMTSYSKTPSSTVLATVALQRLRLEISSAVLKEPFTHAAALQLALPWVKHDAQPPGWESEQDVLHNADVLAASLSVLRFILLQRLAMNRKISRGTDEDKEKREDDEPVRLQSEKLKSLRNKHLSPLHACTINLIRQIKENSNENTTAAAAAELEMFLALQRLEDVLERTIEAAKELS